MRTIESAGTRIGFRRFASATLGVVVGAALVLGGGGCRRGDDSDVASSEKPAAPAAAAPAGTSGAVTGSKKSGPGGAAAKSEANPPAGAKAATTKSGKKGKAAAPAIPPPAVAVVVPAEELSNEQLSAEVRALRDEHAKLQAGVRSLTPDEPYILINTTLNRLSMKAGDRYLLQEGIVSTGSNTELVEPNGKRSWFFSTPKGVHVVKRKMVAPIWTKPDWAFIEEGEPVPGAQAESRFEEGTLGKYALYFGNGYMIHGTLFQRFLGQSVTHGCVRVGDADLETVYQNAKVGTKIYIY